MEVLKRIIFIESQDFYNKMLRRNVPYVHLLYLFIYQLFSNNFKIKPLLQIWNFLFKDPTTIPLYLILIAVWLIKFYSDKLKKCHRFTEIS